MRLQSLVLDFGLHAGLESLEASPSLAAGRRSLKQDLGITLTGIPQP